MSDQSRLIEVAFPLKQASIDSVHEKNVRHGHISTLHIWPARRPLAACRAALIATLLPDPGTPEERKRLLERLAGTVVEVTRKKKLPSGRIEEIKAEETVGGILHWGRESSPDLAWFRERIRDAYGGRAPRVLDPFAGGGAIPLEAMRLGCEATAGDINPVAWFILKCTLEYPQKLAGQKRRLPDFILKNADFIESFFKAKGYKGALLRSQLAKLGLDKTDSPMLSGLQIEDATVEADLAWHVRAWGTWVLDQARVELAPYYPTYAEFQPLDPSARRWEHRELRQVLILANGSLDLDALNSEFDGTYLKDEKTPRWVPKPAVAYLWARTVTCKVCRATIPLLKTRWLCKKDNKRVVLTMERPHPLAPSPRSGEGVGTEFGQHDREQASIAPVPGYVYELARKARVNQTNAESQVWEILRDRRLGGWKFRRQHPLGRYVADFYCADAKLVVELDGLIHDTLEQREYDHVRSQDLTNRGMRVLRFRNSDVEENLFEAVHLILTHLSASQPRGDEPHPSTPSPFDGEGAEPDVRTSSPFNRDEAGPDVRIPSPFDRDEAGPDVRIPSPSYGEGAGGEVSSVVFGIAEAPSVGANPAQRREHDKRVGAGTMSGAGATCPICGAVNTMSDLRAEGIAGRLGTTMTAVVVDGAHGKEYRLPRDDELNQAEISESDLGRIFSALPFGMVDEATPRGGSGASRAFSVAGYGLGRWRDIYSPRQLLSLGVFTGIIRALSAELTGTQYGSEWVEPIVSFACAVLSRLADRNSELCTWQVGAEKIGHTFSRFALPITWDFVEVMPWSEASGGFAQAVEWVAEVVEHLQAAAASSPTPEIFRGSATTQFAGEIDVVLTDPPYYDAIPYSDLMDFFYIWLRRSLFGLSQEIDANMESALGPKWDHTRGDGELIDDSSRFGGDSDASRNSYESGMSRAFQACGAALKSDGRLVIVFAHKTPAAWETLVSAVIAAGFVVDGSWPIQTERVARTRSLSSAALSSSIWLVCKKRPLSARPGWDTLVLNEMQEKITSRLREFWDAGIRGPDFVWAATGPALEAYSKHPIVRKANSEGNQIMSVSEFLGHVRRMVVDFVVGRVLSTGGDASATAGLDDATTYYLLHRHDFGLEDAPIGACILYAVSCGLSDHDLKGPFDLLTEAGGHTVAGETDALGSDDDEEDESRTSSAVRLKPWNLRKRRNLGYPDGARTAPLIDQLHRLMQLWKSGKQLDVEAFVDERGLRHNSLFPHVLQALVELASAGSEERAILESVSNYLAARGLARQEPLPI